MTLLALVEIVPVSVPLSVPPPVALLSVIVVLLVGLAGLPLASCDCTDTLNAVPAVPVLGTAVYTSFVAAPGLTVKGALLPAVSVSPLVRVAVSTTPLSAFVYVTPLMVTEFVPAAIVPVSVPPKVPVPVLRLRPTPVLSTALDGLPLLSWACTTTENPVPAVGFAPPFTEVIASLVAGPGLKATVTVPAALSTVNVQVVLPLPQVPVAIV